MCVCVVCMYVCGVCVVFVHSFVCVCVWCVYVCVCGVCMCVCMCVHTFRCVPSGDRELTWAI